MGDNSDQVIRYYFDKDQDHSFNKIKKVKVATQMLYFIIKNMNNEEKKKDLHQQASRDQLQMGEDRVLLHHHQKRY